MTSWYSGLSLKPISGRETYSRHALRSMQSIRWRTWRRRSWPTVACLTTARPVSKKRTNPRASSSTISIWKRTCLNQPWNTIAFSQVKCAKSCLQTHCRMTIATFSTGLIKPSRTGPLQSMHPSDLTISRSSGTRQQKLGRTNGTKSTRIIHHFHTLGTTINRRSTRR